MSEKESPEILEKRIAEELEKTVCSLCPMSKPCSVYPLLHCRAFDILLIRLFHDRSLTEGKGEPKKDVSKPKTTNFVKWLLLSAWKAVKWIVKKWKDHIRGKKK